jgi:hypothetical protein
VIERMKILKGALKKSSGVEVQELESRILKLE